MRVMRIEAIYQKPNTSRRHPKSLCLSLPFADRGDGLVQPTGSGLAFVNRDGGIEALQEALDRYGSPDIFNTDQGVQFTSEAFTGVLASSGIRISMDGKGRYLDNIFIERLWRSLKYEDVYIKAYASVPDARRAIGGWLSFTTTNACTRLSIT
jgi:Integrase core domain